MSNTGWKLGFFLLLVSSMAVAQTSQKKQTVVVNGHSGDAIVYQIDGRAFIDLETLVRIANGSISFRGNQIILSLPAAEAGQAQQAENTGSITPTGMTPEFQRAAVNHLGDAKNWINVLVYAAQHGVPGDGSRLVVLHDRAVESLRQAQVAAASDAGQSAFQLLSNNFNNLSNWSDKLIRERRSMDTGKYSMAPDAMANDPTYQKISNCTKFLSDMIPSGQFSDDGSCH